MPYRRSTTIKKLLAANRLYSDWHIHIEGVRFTDDYNKNIFIKSIDRIISKDKINNRFEEITRRPSTLLKEQFLSDSMHSANVKFNFSEFLTKLYASKAILVSHYSNANKFIRKTLKDYYRKYWHVEMGIMPSLPNDFPHLDRYRWYKSVFKGFAEGASKHPIGIVIETKRKHLTEKDSEGRYVFEQNLDFVKYCYKNRTKNMKISIGICDDESNYPLFVPERLEQLSRYLDIVKKHPQISVYVHSLELNIAELEHSIKRRVINNPAYEVEVILELLKSKKIIGATFVHMCRIFGNARRNFLERTETDKKHIKNGLKYIKEIMKNNHRIIICASSNRLLDNPLLFEYPEILKLLLQGKLNIVLGTDDPGPFNVTDISSELEYVVKEIKKAHKDGIEIRGIKYSAREVAALAKFVLIRNSWRYWDYETKSWIEPNLRTIQRKYGLHKDAFMDVMHYDICPYIDHLKIAATRRVIIRRELRRKLIK